MDVFLDLPLWAQITVVVLTTVLAVVVLPWREADWG